MCFRDKEMCLNKECTETVEEPSGEACPLFSFHTHRAVVCRNRSDPDDEKSSVSVSAEIVSIDGDKVTPADILPNTNNAMETVVISRLRRCDECALKHWRERNGGEDPWISNRKKAT